MEELDYHHLIAKKFSGEISPLEEAMLQKWVEESPENQESLAQLEEILSVAEPPAASPAPDVNMAWSELEDSLGLSSSPVADMEDAPGPARTAAAPSTTRPSSPGLFERLFSGGGFLRPAFSLAVVLLIAAAGYFAAQKYFGQPLPIEVTTEFGERTVVSFPDGSTAHLNSGSTIRYLEAFSDSERTVFLDGEGFFVVSKDANRPFIVESGFSQAEVLGTEFNVWNRNRQSRVIVKEGKVALRAANQSPDAGVVLSAGKMSEVSENGLPAAPQSVDVDHLLGWLDGRIVFEQTPLHEIAAELQRYYNVSIELTDPSINDRTVTGTFENQTIAEVLDIICKTLQLDVQIAEEKATISPSGKGI